MSSIYYCWLTQWELEQTLINLKDLHAFISIGQDAYALQIHSDDNKNANY
jgi:hypothetical protein